MTVSDWIRWAEDDHTWPSCCRRYTLHFTVPPSTISITASNCRKRIWVSCSKCSYSRNNALIQTYPKSRSSLHFQQSRLASREEFPRLSTQEKPSFTATSALAKRPHNHTTHHHGQNHPPATQALHQEGRRRRQSSKEGRCHTKKQRRGTPHASRGTSCQTDRDNCQDPPPLSNEVGRKNPSL